MRILPATTERVTANTPAAANDEIARQTRERLWRKVHDGDGGIECGIEELDGE